MSRLTRQHSETNVPQCASAARDFEPPHTGIHLALVAAMDRPPRRRTAAAELFEEWGKCSLGRLRAILGALGPASFVRAKWRLPEEPLEPRVRRVVAERLAVGPEELAPEVSLTDDLAADSLDLLDLAVGLEKELAISLSDSTMARLSTYGELVAVAQARTRERRAREAWAESERTPPFVWVRIVPPRERGSLDHAGWLTPYTAETIVDSALRGGAGTRFDLSVAPNVGEPVMARLRAEFAWLRCRHIAVHIRRDRRLPPLAA